MPESYCVDIQFFVVWLEKRDARFRDSRCAVERIKFCMFELTAGELKGWRCQYGTSNVEG